MSRLQRCPYCKMPQLCEELVDHYTGQVIRDIIDHPCRKFPPVAPLDPTPTDTSFLREAWNEPEAFVRWAKATR